MDSLALSLTPLVAGIRGNLEGERFVEDGQRASARFKASAAQAWETLGHCEVFQSAEASRGIQSNVNAFSIEMFALLCTSNFCATSIACPKRMFCAVRQKCI